MSWSPPFFPLGFITIEMPSRGRFTVAIKPNFHCVHTIAKPGPEPTIIAWSESSSPRFYRGRGPGCYQSRPSPLLASVLRARSFLALLLFASQELVRDPTYRLRDSAYRICDSAYRIRYLRSCSRSVLVGPREVQHDARLLPNGPSVVSRRDHHGIVGAKLLLCAVVHDDLHPPRDHVPDVRHLATVGSCDRLDGLRPLPSWLEGSLPHGYIVEGHYVHLPLVE